MDSAGSRRESGVSPFADSANSSSPSNVSTDHIPIDVLFESTSGGINEFFLTSDAEEQIGMSRVAVDPDSDDEVLAEFSSVIEDFFSSESESDDDMEHYIPPLPYGEFKDWEMFCTHVYRDDLLLLRPTMNSWKLYPKSSVHVLDLTNGKTVYMFVDRVYPIRATLLERMLRHKLTVPPSYCRDVVVAGSVIQTVQTSLRQSFECLHKLI
ncbi:hypothetical protein Tco_0890586 [Tanacetum coccineum]|uniref:Uncharacterized protein n=1 Tax=Tanacetum coccineum TaxID=301880 RepID=A0ABQ5C6F5_9ASTR